MVINLDATKKIYTYTYPATFALSQIKPLVTSMVYDTTNDPTNSVTVTLTNTDTFTLSVISGVPQTIQGGAWTLANGVYSASFTSNGILKTLKY